MPGRWFEDKVAGHLVDCFEPDQASPHGFTVIYLHDAGQTRLVDNPVFTQLFNQHGLRVAAPQSGPSWWTDRICPAFDPDCSAERHVVERVLPSLAERWGVQPPQIALCGVSMGGQGALRISFKHPSRFPVVAAIAPAIDYQVLIDQGDETLWTMYGGDRERARQDTATLHVHPLNWPRHTWFCCDPADAAWYESVERLQMKLSSLGIMHSCDLETSAGGHSWAYFNHMVGAALAFVVEALERERLRVV
jgi:pimeloyl-ACP methyl ester carboxylesterase